MTNFRNRLAAFIVGFSLLAGGCTVVGPDFEKPETRVNDNWMDAGDSRLQVAESDYREWWKVFNDPKLDRLIEIAYRENLSLKVAGLRVLEARAQLGVAVGNLYPKHQARAGANYVALSEAGANTAGGDLDYWDFEAGFDSSWELDVWGKFRRGVEAADAGLLATLASYDDILVSLIAEVATTYVVIRTFEERIQLAKDNVETQQRSLNIANVRYESGATTELDVQQARTLLHNTQAQVPQLQVGLRQAHNALSILLNRAPGELKIDLGVSGGIPVAPLEVVVDLPAELLRRRPDIRRAEMDAAAQSALIGVAKAELYPSFSLVGSIGVRAAGNTNTTESGKDGAGELFKGSSLEFIGGPSFRWNIFNFGRIENSVRAQDARFQQFIADYQETVIRAAAEVENSIAGFIQSQESEKYLRNSFQAASRSSELALIQYRAGVIDYQRVLDSDSSLLAQQDLWTQTRSDISRNLIAIYKALGGGWEIRRGNELVPSDIREQMRQRTDWGRMLESGPTDSSIPDQTKTYPGARDAIQQALTQTN